MKENNETNGSPFFWEHASRKIQYSEKALLCSIENSKLLVLRGQFGARFSSHDQISTFAWCHSYSCS